LKSIENSYLTMLRWSLAHRGVIMLICLATFLSTFGYITWSAVTGSRPMDQAELQSSFTLPEGTGRWRRRALMASDMATRISSLPEVSFVQSYTHGPTHHRASVHRPGARAQRKLSP